MEHLEINYNHISDRKVYTYISWILIVFYLSVITNDIIKDLKTLEDLFDFSNLHEHHELFSKRNKKNYW